LKSWPLAELATQEKRVYWPKDAAIYEERADANVPGAWQHIVRNSTEVATMALKPWRSTRFKYYHVSDGPSKELF
jgi:hypothetical protein